MLLGLGSILGTGIFVSLGIAAGVAGSAVIVAVALAAVVAALNGLASAQLAASHPVSGGTYEYGYRYLGPTPGFAAGWVFLSAKSASAATAALGLAGYLLAGLGITDRPSRIGVALLAIGALTAVVAAGMQRSMLVNAAIVTVTLLALGGFVLAGARAASAGFDEHLAGIFDLGTQDWPALLHATALLFVAYTGYGRIATLGEEIREPGRSIPRAIGLTLVLTLLLYGAVAVVAVGAVGAGGLASATYVAAAPLERIARGFAGRGMAALVAIGAVTAMLGVLLNLLLGLSRVVLAMARRGDLPHRLARVDSTAASPRRAVVATGIGIAALAATGDLRLTWSFSAFTVLIYYAVTNLAALRLPRDQRPYGAWLPACGLVACFGLAFWIERPIWLAGLAWIAIGLLGRAAMHRLARRRADARVPPPRNRG